MFVGFLLGALVVADQAQAQPPTFRRPMRAREAPSPTPTHLPPRPVAARATTLLILVSGSSEDDSGVWGKSLGVSIPRSLTLGVTAFSDYASVLWEVADRPFEESDPVVIRSGHFADAAAPGELLVIVISSHEFLPPGRPPEPPEEYFIRVTTLDADHNKVGTSNSVRLMYATDNALVLPSVALASPGDAVRVSQSCDGNRTLVVLCVADSQLGWNQPRCSGAHFSCLPYSCHKAGETCNSACLDDSDCAQPARCYHGTQGELFGVCSVPIARCTGRTLLATRFETFDCFPYACHTLDSGQAFCAACPCKSGLDCAHDTWCRADGTCGEPRD
jgi:hypothetical protein